MEGGWEINAKHSLPPSPARCDQPACIRPSAKNPARTSRYGGGFVKLRRSGRARRAQGSSDAGLLERDLGKRGERRKKEVLPRSIRPNEFPANMRGDSAYPSVNSHLYIPPLLPCLPVFPWYRQVRRMILSSAFRRKHGNSPHNCLFDYRASDFIGRARHRCLQARSQTQAQGPLALGREPGSTPASTKRLCNETRKILLADAQMQKPIQRHCNFFTYCYIDFA